MKPLHAITLALLLIIGALYWYTGQQQERYDAAATQYLRSAFADIGSWERAALQRQLADEALAALSAEQLDAIAARYRPLGGFVQLGEVTFTRLTSALSLLGRTRLLSYHGSAQFEHGSADFTATLVIRDNGFRFYNLSFSSPQLRQ